MGWVLFLWGQDFKQKKKGVDEWGKKNMFLIHKKQTVTVECVCVEVWIVFEDVVLVPEVNVINCLTSLFIT